MKHKLAIGVLTQHKRNAQKRPPWHGSLARDVATEDDCNSPTVNVYTNAETVMIIFLNARLNQYLVPKM